jgi:hypothetical protein
VWCNLMTRSLRVNHMLNTVVNVNNKVKVDFFIRTVLLMPLKTRSVFFFSNLISCDRTLRKIDGTVFLCKNSREMKTLSLGQSLSLRLLHVGGHQWLVFFYVVRSALYPRRKLLP